MHIIITGSTHGISEDLHIVCEIATKQRNLGGISVLVLIDTTFQWPKCALHHCGQL